MKSFWDIRSEHYDKLFWTKDESYLKQIKDVGGFKKKDIVLDVGSGTGAVAKYLKSSVGHMFCVDISSGMLSKGQWDDMSVVKWNIANRLFVDNLFDKIVARMVFHHITHGLDRTLVRCHDMLHKGGKLVIAEGIPPVDDDDVVQWYTDMFKLKEDRITFRENDLSHKLGQNGYKNIKKHFHINPHFSIHNWLVNSGLDKATRDKIFKMHVNAPPKVKEAYQMKITKTDCIVRTVSLIVVGVK